MTEYPISHKGTTDINEGQEKLIFIEFFQTVQSAGFFICSESSFKQKLVMGCNAIKFRAKGALGQRPVMRNGSNHLHFCK